MSADPADLPPAIDMTTADTGPDQSACVPTGADCDDDNDCCSFGECAVQGTCRPRPCSSTDDCAGLQCVRAAGSVEARQCAEPECADCVGQNWCHPTVGCTNREPCSSTDACASNEVCTAENLCVPTCQSSADCGGRECRELRAEDLADADINARVCAPALCNCRDPDDYCSIDGLCIEAGTSCGVEIACGESRYSCDGVRCVCDDSLDDVCRFDCATNADCGDLQVCDTALRRCQTEYCAPGDTCPEGYVCGSDGSPPWGAAVCRRAGATAFGEACTDSSDCASGLCVNNECSQICRETADCPADHDCTWQNGWSCVPRSLAPCEAPCGPTEFCIFGNPECQTFCSSGADCPADSECVTGFGVYKCLGADMCPDDQLLSIFTEECRTFCFTDSDCPNQDCDETLNLCRVAE